MTPLSEQPPGGDPILVRRAEAAEANANALEESLAGIQERLRDAERQYADASGRLAERERELRSTTERLAGGERELHSVSSLLREREGVLGALSERLGQREVDLRAISERLAEREVQLRRAELEIAPRLAELERHVSEVQGALAGERAARVAAESELQRMRGALEAIRPMVVDLRRLAERLRAAAEQGDRSTPSPSSARPAPDAGAQMTEALAAAVERLRARVSEPQPPEVETAVEDLPDAEPTTVGPAGAETAGAESPQTVSANADAESVQDVPAGAESTPAADAGPTDAGPTDAGPTDAGPTDAESTDAESTDAESTDAESTDAESTDATPVEYVPPVATGPGRGEPWLAAAIRRLAEHRGSKLGGELVLELLPAQALVVSGPLRYTARIAGVGDFEVVIQDGAVGVSKVRADTGSDGPAPPAGLVLAGDVRAFAEIAGGGVPRSRIARRRLGLRIEGSRRTARRLLAARRRPVALSEVAQAGIAVWPGLLLAALAEAVDPAWTREHSFTVCFAIEGRQSSVLEAQARGGERLIVRRGQSSGAADATLRLGERAFACMIAGRPLPAGEKATLSGRVQPLEQLLSWTDRVQGIRRFDA